MAETLDPVNIGSNVTLSGGNLVATYSNGGIARTLTSYSSGKHYFEITRTSAGSAAAVGIANSSQDLNSGNLNGTLSANCAVIYGNSQVQATGSDRGNTGGGIVGAGTVICVAVDLDNSKIWWRYGSGLWNNSGTDDPATNTGGTSFSGLSLPAYGIVENDGASGTVWTAAFSSFAQTPPSGFSAWGAGTTLTAAATFTVKPKVSSSGQQTIKAIATVTTKPAASATSKATLKSSTTLLINPRALASGKSTRKAVSTLTVKDALLPSAKVVMLALGVIGFRAQTPNAIKLTDHAQALLQAITNVVSGGRSFYIANAGSDSNPGTISLPWQTVGKVNAQSMLPGDTYFFKGSDTFTDATLAPTSGGLAGSAIKFTSYSSGTATISRTASIGFSATNLSYITLDTLIFTGSAGTTQSGIVAAYTAGTSHGLVLNNLSVSGFASDGIRIDCSGGGILDGLTINTCTASGNTLVDNSNALGTGGINCRGVYGAQVAGVYQLKNVLINGCAANGNTGASGAPNWTGSGIFVGESDSALITQCVTHGNGASGNGGVGCWFGDTKNSTIRFCESYGNLATTTDGSGFDIDGGCDNCVIEKCYSHGNAGNGFMMYTYDDPGFITGTHNCTIRFCISENDGATSTNFGSIFVACEASATMTNANVFGCTVYQGNAAKACFQTYTNGGTLTGNISNCIFYAGSTAEVIEANSSNPSGLAFHGNDYFSIGTFVIRWNGSTYNSLAAWQAGATQDSQGKSVDPLLVNPGGGGTIGGYVVGQPSAYRLQSHSPMQATGLDLALLFAIAVGSTDFYSNAIVSSALNIGAWSAALNSLRNAVLGIAATAKTIRNAAATLGARPGDTAIGAPVGASGRAALLAVKAAITATTKVTLRAVGTLATVDRISATAASVLRAAATISARSSEAGSTGATALRAAALAMRAGLSATAKTVSNAVGTLSARQTYLPTGKITLRAVAAVGARVAETDAGKSTLSAAAALTGKLSEAGATATANIRGATLAARAGLAATAKVTLRAVSLLNSRATAAVAGTVTARASATIGAITSEIGRFPATVARAGSLAARLGISAIASISSAVVIVWRPMLKGSDSPPTLKGTDQTPDLDGDFK